MQYFDTHAHVFPDHIVEKVIDTLQDFYQFKWQGKGIVSDLLARMDEAGVQRAVIFSAATKAEQVQAVNNYVAAVVAQYPDRFIGLGSIHPDYKDYEAELVRIKNLGLRGLKFHPDFQQIRIDQQEVVNICRAAGPDFPILFHVGDKRFDFSSPRRMAHLLELVPEMTAIAAHMGGYSEWEEAWKHLVGKNVYFDTSSTFSFLEPQEVKRIIAAHGVDRILWASDYPAATQKQAITDLMQLDLSPEDQEKIFHRNAEKLCGITT